jgi:hypothetical protein
MEGLKAACDSDADCLTGHCAAGVTRNFCTITCSAEAACPKNWSCNEGLCSVPSGFRDPCVPDDPTSCPGAADYCVPQVQACYAFHEIDDVGAVCCDCNPNSCGGDLECTNSGYGLYICQTEANLHTLEPAGDVVVGATPTLTWEPVLDVVDEPATIMFPVSVDGYAGLPQVYYLLSPQTTSFTVGSPPPDDSIDMIQMLVSPDVSSAASLEPGYYSWALWVLPCPFDLSDGGEATFECTSAFFGGFVPPDHSLSSYFYVE